MGGRLATAEVSFTNAVLQLQLQDLITAYPDPSVAMAQVLSASKGSAPPTPTKQQRPQQQQQRPVSQAAASSFELDLAEFEKDLEAAAAASKMNREGQHASRVPASQQPKAAERKPKEDMPPLAEHTIGASTIVDSDGSQLPELAVTSTNSASSDSQFAAQVSNIHVLNERVELLEGIAEDAKRSADEAKRSLAATKRAAATQIQEAQAHGQAQATKLEERINSLEELNEQLEHEKTIFIDAHAVLKSRLGATEDEKRSVQQELKAAQDERAFMCEELDRLRASVEEMVTQSATSSGDGVAHATVGAGLRRANSLLTGERTHLSIGPTTSSTSSNGGSSVGTTAAMAAMGTGEQPAGAREHRRSLVAISLRPGF